jgi:hypothetical protein
MGSRGAKGSSLFYQPPICNGCFGCWLGVDDTAGLAVRFMGLRAILMPSQGAQSASRGTDHEHLSVMVCY